MKLFIASRSNSNKSKKGYYGALTFLDSQHECDSTFKICPIIIPMIPTSYNSIRTHKLFRDYANKCKFDMFMHLCMMENVGHNKFGTTLNVQKNVFKLVLSIKYISVERPVQLIVTNYLISSHNFPRACLKTLLHSQYNCVLLTYPQSCKI